MGVTSTENSAKLPVRSTLQYWITLIVCTTELARSVTSSEGRVLTSCIADTTRTVLFPVCLTLVTTCKCLPEAFFCQAV